MPVVDLLTELMGLCVWKLTEMPFFLYLKKIAATKSSLLKFVNVSCVPCVFFHKIGPELQERLPCPDFPGTDRDGIQWHTDLLLHVKSAPRQ